MAEPVSPAGLNAGCAVLATVFAVLAALSAYRFISLHLSVAAWTRQKGVHMLVTICALLRVIFFALVPQWDGVYFYVRMTGTSTVDTGLYILEEAPTLLLLTLYSQQLLMWAESYHTTVGSMDLYDGPVIWSVRVFNLFAYTAHILIWILYDRTSGSVDQDTWSLISALLQTAYFIMVAIALSVYGFKVRKTMQMVPVGLNLRLRQMRKIGLVTAACTAAFLIRAVAIAAASYAAWTDLNGFDESITATDVAMTVLFFLTTELTPLLAVLRFNGGGSKSAAKTKMSAIGAGSRSPYRVNRVSSGSRLHRPLQSARFSFSPSASPTAESPRAGGLASAFPANTQEKASLVRHARTDGYGTTVADEVTQLLGASASPNATRTSSGT